MYLFMYVCYLLELASLGGLVLTGWTGYGLPALPGVSHAAPALATALLVIGTGFVIQFPALMYPKYFMIGLVLFVCGWLAERTLLRR